MGETLPAYKVLIEYASEETDDENLIVLKEAQLTTAIDWGGDQKDRVLLVTQPKSENAIAIDTSKLGNCASLLETTTQ